MNKENLLKLADAVEEWEGEWDFADTNKCALAVCRSVFRQAASSFLGVNAGAGPGIFTELFVAGYAIPILTNETTKEQWAAHARKIAERY